MDKKEILKDIDTVIELTEDFSRLSHLFSRDSAKASIAKLRRAAVSLKSHLDLDNVKSIRNVAENGDLVWRSRKEGSLVEVKPCGDEKTYIGIYMGDFALGVSYKVVGNELQVIPSFNNPAIFVPELNHVVFGCESWWRTIDSVEDAKGISLEDIENCWYVKLLKKNNEDNEDNDD